jgi:hypothetical protein
MEKKKVVRGTDEIKINTGDGAELKYWSTKFGVRKVDIKTAVNEVGDSLTAVTNYFRSHRR